MDRQFLKDMLKTPSVSGYETQLQKKVLAHMRPYADKQHTDATGNVISIMNEESKLRILLCGHVDEIGFIVTNVTAEGMLKVTKAGGIHPVLYLGTHVRIISAKGNIAGVVITTSDLEKRGQLPVDALTIDIGASSREEALQHVAVGDSVCAATDSEELLNERFCGRALDDRIGAFIIMEAFQKAKEKKCRNGVYCATTVGEETTMRGAYSAAVYAKPTCAVIVDVTFTSDYPGVDGNVTGEVSLDKGPVLCKSSLVNDRLNERLLKLSEELHIPVQWEIAAGKAGTDGDMVYFTNMGVPIVLISIPLRYMHSSVETASYRDMQQCINLLSEFLCTLEEDFDYCPLS